VSIFLHLCVLLYFMRLLHLQLLRIPTSLLAGHGSVLDCPPPHRCCCCCCGLWTRSCNGSAWAPSSQRIETASAFCTFPDSTAALIIIWRSAPYNYERTTLWAPLLNPERHDLVRLSFSMFHFFFGLRKFKPLRNQRRRPTIVLCSNTSPMLALSCRILIRTPARNS